MDTTLTIIMHDLKKVLLFRKYNYIHEKQIQVIPTIFVETFKKSFKLSLLPNALGIY